MGDERGQATPLVALALVAMMIGVAVVLAVGAAASERGRAQTAADAAALAGAAEGESAARQLAAANGASLERFTLSGDVVEVEVRIGDSNAVARAEVYLRPPAGP